MNHLYNVKGYRTLHYWIREQKGEPIACERCPKKAPEFKIQWANKSQKYKKDVSDWMTLCVSCHKKNDARYTNGTRGMKIPALQGANNWNWKGGLVKLNCEMCENVFEVKQHRVGKAKYCNQTCYRKRLEVRPAIHKPSCQCFRCTKTYWKFTRNQ